MLFFASKMLYMSTKMLGLPPKITKMLDNAHHTEAVLGWHSNFVFGISTLSICFFLIVFVFIFSEKYNNFPGNSIKMLK